MEIGLDNLGCRNLGTVTKINGDDVFVDRLRSFGLIPGTQVKLRYKSPSGSVIAIEFNATVIALRKKDARKIQVIWNG